MSTPDLRAYHLVHDAMRRSSHRLARALVGLVDEASRFDADRLDALRWYTDALAGEVRGHELAEERVLFPALAERVPVFADYRSGLGADHAHLDDVLDVLTSAVASIADGRDWYANLAGAVDAATELARFLDDHVAGEDADVLPLFARHFDAVEYAALERRASRPAGIRYLTSTVPWLATTVPSVATELMATASPSVRWAWRATRWRYARLTGLALGPSVGVAAG